MSATPLEGWEKAAADQRLSVTPTSPSDPIIRGMKLWLTITNLYHFAAWLVGLEHFATITKPIREPWF